MMFDFAYFREQTCIVACPYGRLQTVLLDNQSLIVGYDAARGEPRAKPKKKLPVIGEARGDCVDCGACVATCPTGIDIRQGLQMECIGCAQCIDACDAVMDKLERPRHLIGYTSQDVLAGKPKRVLRARTLVYPALLVVVSGLLVWGVGSRESTKLWIDRIQGQAFVELPDGGISSQVRIKLENESDQTRIYSLSLHGSSDTKLRAGALTFEVKPHKSIEMPLFVDAPRTTYIRGKRQVTIRVADDRGFARLLEVTLLGPEGDAR
jgi:cytochrome c oxidase accessory protein FixG